MSSGGAVTLGEIAGRLSVLEVACSRCERRGRLNVAKLIERHGVDARLPDLREILAGDCSRTSAVSAHERCGVHYPQLVVALRSSTRDERPSNDERPAKPVKLTVLEQFEDDAGRGRR